MKKLFHLTQSGVDEMRAELTALQEKRILTADAIKSARELGDLGENAEYQTARAEQERTEGRISEVEHILANASIIQTPKSSKQVSLGSTVTLKNSKGKELVLQVVGPIEADPLAKKISDESPIGKALLGKKEGEDVDIVTPVETATYKVHSIA